MREIHHARNKCGEPYPRDFGGRILPRRLPATGRRYQHPTWQAIGAWKVGHAVGGPVPEARCIRSRQNVSNGVVPLAALAGSRCDRDGSAQFRSRAGTQSMHRDPKSPHAGAGRQPPDREVPRAAHAGSRGGLSKASWRAKPPPVAEYGTRVRRFIVLTLAERGRQEETARAPADGRRRTLLLACLRHDAPGRQSCCKHASGMTADLAALVE